MKNILKLVPKWETPLSGLSSFLSFACSFVYRPSGFFFSGSSGLILVLISPQFLCFLFSSASKVLL